jgi:methylase of polypeptide subunit release factors
MFLNDILVPYIEQDDPCLKDLIHEPQTALVSGKDGLDSLHRQK